MKLLDCLLVLFIALKLTGHIEWSWWAVTAPFWLPFIVAFVTVMIDQIAKHVRQASAKPK